MRISRGPITRGITVAKMPQAHGALAPRWQVGYRVRYDSYWHPATDEGLAAVAFSPRSAILVTAFGVALDGTDIVWDITDLSRPRHLSQFEGGQPMVLSPDGRTVATVTFGRLDGLVECGRPQAPGQDSDAARHRRQQAVGTGVLPGRQDPGHRPTTTGSSCGT